MMKQKLCMLCYSVGSNKTNEINSKYPECFKRHTLLIGSLRF